MKTIGLSSARAWKYHSPSLMEDNLKLGQIYFFKGGSAYFHHPQKPVRLGYKHKNFIFIQSNYEIKVSIFPRSLANRKIIAWFKTWAKEKDSLFTVGGKKNHLTREAKTGGIGESIINSEESVYFILNTDSHAVKIGRAKDVSRRMATLQIANPVKLLLLKTIEVNSNREAKKEEEKLHNKFSHLRVRGEWFMYDTELQNFITNL